MALTHYSLWVLQPVPVPSAVVVALVIVVAFCFIEKPKCIQIKPQFLYLMDE